jgi:hypothetical protein
MSALQINIPEIVAEVSEIFARYEKALIGNDIETLNAMFWKDARVLRYGIAESLYGHEAIAGFRAARPTIDLARDLFNTVITTFGRDFATANTEYRRKASGKLGRQSQTWARLPEGWRIVAAHVSFPAA